MSGSRETDPGLVHGSRFLVGILVFALVVRVGAMILLHTWTFPTEREFGFETGEIGYAIANGQGFSWPQTWRAVGPGGQVSKRDHPVPTTWEAPVYPVIIAAAFWCFGSYSAKAAMALESFQILLSLIGCLVLYRLGKQLFNERAGLIAAFMFSLYPAAVYFSIRKTEYSILLSILSLLLLLGIIELSARPSKARAVALGALCGLATLVNPVIMAFYPFALLWFVARSSTDWLNRIKYSAALIGTCAVLMAPWLIRNYVVFNQFVFLRPNFTMELVRSNFPEQRPQFAKNYKDTNYKDSNYKDTNHKDTNEKDTNEGRMSAAFNQAATNLVLKSPVRFVWTSAQRAFQYWARLDSTGRGTELLAGISYYPILLLGLAGAWAARRNRQAQLLIVFLLSMPLPFYVTWVTMGRYRFPVEPVLILFTSYVLSSAVARLLALARPGGVMPSVAQERLG
jgi:4-amino-4-deoxy-L-arabinose transferase-like glycosyltransferase